MYLSDASLTYLKAQWQKCGQTFPSLHDTFLVATTFIFIIALIKRMRAIVCATMVKRSLACICGSHRAGGQLEDRGWYHWTGFPTQLVHLAKAPLDTPSSSREWTKPRFARQSSHRKAATERELASGRPAVKLTKRKRKQPVNNSKGKGGVKPDKTCQEGWSSPDLCRFREWWNQTGLTHYKRKKKGPSGSLTRKETLAAEEMFFESSWSGLLQSHQSGCNRWRVFFFFF